MIALAYRDIFVSVENESMIADMTAEEVESELTLVAMVSIMDPIREEVIPAVQQCHRAGIIVKMLTGVFAFVWLSRFPIYCSSSSHVRLVCQL